MLTQGNSILKRLSDEEYPLAMVLTIQFAVAKELIMIRNRVKEESKEAVVTLAKSLFEVLVAREFEYSYYYMGMIYELGIGAETNIEKARSFYSMGRNDPQCLFKLSILDSDRCLEYTKRAAQLGLPEAQHNLAIMYYDKGNNRNGVAWQLQAARQRFFPAMINIGTVFLHGKSEIVSNPIAAHIWFKEAQKVEDSPELQKLIQEAEALINKY